MQANGIVCPWQLEFLCAGLQGPSRVSFSGSVFNICLFPKLWLEMEIKEQGRGGKFIHLPRMNLSLRIQAGKMPQFSLSVTEFRFCFLVTP